MIDVDRPIPATRVRAPAALGRTIVSIQFLRFIAALAVVLFHAHQAIARGTAEDAAAPAIAYLFGLGASGVHIFFCISGFVMVYTSYCRDAGPFTPGDFMRKRMLRIYPIYWLCAAAYVVFHLAVPPAYALTVREILGALLLFPDDAPRIIGPAWTLMFEMYFYICFCIFMMLGLRAGLVAMTMAFTGLVAVGTVWPGNPLHPLLTSSLLLEFVAGAWIAYVAIRRPALLAAIAPAALLLGIAGFVAGTVIGYARLPSFVMWGAPATLLLAGVIGVEAAGRLPRAVARLSFLGDGSYFLYLSHILLIDALLLTPLAWLRGSDAAIIAATVIAASICAVLAVLAFDHVERPMLRRLRRMLLRG